jgi:hypothetical protein
MPTFVSELPPSYRPSCFRIKIHPCRVNLATESRLGSHLRTSICRSLTYHLGQRTTTKCRSGSFSSCSYATAALRADVNMVQDGDVMHTDSAGQVLVSASRHLIARSEKIYFLLMTLFALSLFLFSAFSAFQLPKTPTTEGKRCP